MQLTSNLLTWIKPIQFPFWFYLASKHILKTLLSLFGVLIYNISRNGTVEWRKIRRAGLKNLLWDVLKCELKVQKCRTTGDDQTAEKRRDQQRNGTCVYYSHLNLKMHCEAQNCLSTWYKSKVQQTFLHERTWECHYSTVKYKNAIKHWIELNFSVLRRHSESLFDGFADVAVSGSHTRHQDLLSSFLFIFSRFLLLDLEHDLKEVSDVSQEFDPAWKTVRVKRCFQQGEITANSVVTIVRDQKTWYYHGTRAW